MVVAIWSIAFILLAAWSAFAWIFYIKFGEAFDPGTSGILSFLQSFFTVADSLMVVFIIGVWLCGIAMIMLLAVASVTGVMWWRKKQLQKNDLAS